MKKITKPIYNKDSYWYNNFDEKIIKKIVEHWKLNMSGVKIEKRYKIRKETMLYYF